MRTHNDQVYLALPGMFDNAPRNVIFLLFMHVRFNRDAVGSQSCRYLFKIELCLCDTGQVALSMNRRRGVLLYDMQQCDLCMKTGCQGFHR